ncbi:MAG: hypothetical protein C0467_07100 [Planctomycetaceae bacterium]|nr:hypothetical protein [Planctomycetaceae bacterium]
MSHNKHSRKLATATATTSPAPALSSNPTSPGQSGPASITAQNDSTRGAAQDVPDDVKEAIRDNDECAAALEFNNSFKPVEGAEYGWAARHAREQYALADSWFKATDEKAGALIGYLGSVTGVIAIGSGAAVTSGQLNRWVALAAVPSFVCAASAVITAAIARRPATACTPPTGREAAKAANHYHHQPADLAEGSLIGQWQLATALLFWAGDRKSRWLRRATWLFVAAIATLIIPLIVGIIIGPVKACG